LPYGEGVGFWAFGEIVKAQAGILDSDPPEAAHAKLATELERFVPDAGERDWVRARMAPLFGSADQAQDIPRGELFAAWRRFVEGLAADGPLVLVFEDLHWADGSMLALLEDLVERSTEPLLILGAGRPGFQERAPALTADRPNAVALDLPPLTDAQTALLLSSLMQRAVLPADVQSILIERSGGNPLFAEEFVQLLVDQGTVDRDHPDRLLSAIHDIPVPESLQTLIGSRLDALPWPDKTLL
jgi:predicted ATPase